MSRLLVGVTAFGLALMPASAQLINYPNFSSVAGLTLNVNAAQSGSVLRVVPSVLSQRGAAYYSTPVTVENGFDTTFTFQTSAPSGGGADCVAFIVHNDPRGTAAIGNHAGAMGYGAFATSPPGTAIANSLVVEFDTFAGSFNGFSDLSGNEISVHTGGVGDNSQSEGFSLGRVTPATTFSNAAVHTARIHYVPGTLRVYLNNLTTPVLTVPYSFATGGTWVLAPGGPVGGLALLPGGQAYVGFVACTGGSFENYDILSWKYEPGMLLNLSYDPLAFAISLSDVGGNPGDLCINALTLNAGAFPNGWYYGVDVGISELLFEFYSGPPFLTLLDAAGGYATVVPGVPPLGLTFYGVAVDYTPAGIFVKASPPTSLSI
jgi:hypothetical protein